MAKIIKKTKKVKIAEARKYKNYTSVAVEENGEVVMTVNVRPDATPEEIADAIKTAFYTEIGEETPHLKGMEIEVEYEEKEET